jgi:hypothetical protein
VRNLPRWHCPTGEGHPRFDPHAGGVVIDAANCDGRGLLASVEVKPATPPSPDEPPKPAYFYAFWRKSVGVATVSYSISTEGGPETALFSEDLSEGTLKPPPPFHGEAHIAKQGEGWVLTGSLSAHFPGQTVSLTGPGFQPRVGTFEPRPFTIFQFDFSEGC